MNFNAYTSQKSHFDVWFFPLCFVCVMLLLHHIVGSISWPLETANQQRDFNTALGQTLLTGFFWITVRAIHKNVSSTLISILLEKHALSEFQHHRKVLTHQYANHLIWSMTFGVIMPVIYMVNEGLIYRFHEPEVFTIAVSAIAFWLLMATFLLQVTSNTRYIIKIGDSRSGDLRTDYSVIEQSFSMALNNSLLGMSGIALIPVFWINKPIPVLDFLLFNLFSGVLLVYLFLPVYKIFVRFRGLQRARLQQVNEDITSLIRNQASGATNAVSRKIEMLETEKEYLQHVTTVRQKLSVLGVCTLIPACWLIKIALESFLA